MVTLKEHIDLLRKLYIPYKKQLVMLVIDIMRQHYRIASDTLIDTETNDSITIQQFIHAIMTPEPQEATP